MAQVSILHSLFPWYDQSFSDKNGFHPEHIFIGGIGNGFKYYYCLQRVGYFVSTANYQMRHRFFSLRFFGSILVAYFW